MKKVTAYRFCESSLRMISLAAVFLVFLLNVIFTASVSYKGLEIVSYTKCAHISLIMLLAVAVLLVLLARIEHFFAKVNKKLLFALFSLLYSIMAAYLILNVDATLRADPSYVMKAVQSFASGDYRHFSPGKYIYAYPHQTGLLLYELLLYQISSSPVLNFCVNFCFVLGINYFICRISDVLFKSSAVTVITMFLSFAFLPQFFYILFAYGLIPGFFFMLLAFYNTVKFSAEHKIRNIIFAILSASIAICFKQNFLIGGIAIGIYFFLKILKEPKKEKLRFLICLICLAVFLYVPSKLITTYFEEKTGAKLDNGIPAILWVAMGTDIDNTKTAPGWYDASGPNIYLASMCDSDAASKAGINKLSENISKMKTDPKRTLSFFVKKTASQWCEPMFQSVWSGPLESCEQYTNTRLLQSIYSGGTAEKIIAAFLKVLCFIIFGSTFGFLLLKEQKHDGWTLFVMFFIGGLLFHTLWEGKSQYTYPYVFCLIPLSAYCIHHTAERIHRRFERKAESDRD